MKKITVFILMFALLILPALPAFSNMENKGEHLQVMRQAANELQATNPDLAKKLNDFADKKEKWAGKWSDEDKQKYMEQKREDLQKVRQAGNELQATNKDLAKDLTDMADRWEKKIQEKQEKKD